MPHRLKPPVEALETCLADVLQVFAAAPTLSRDTPEHAAGTRVHLSQPPRPSRPHTVEQQTEDKTLVRHADLTPPPQPVSPPPPPKRNLGKYLEPVRFRYRPQPGADSMSDGWHFAENFSDQRRGVTVSNQAWVLAGASRRGYSHWDQGTPRDDAFALGAAHPWNIIAVSDGAGTAEHSRVTANQSVQLAVRRMEEYAQHAPTSPKEAVEYVRQCLQRTIRDVYRAQKDFTEDHNFDKKDTYCTFILLVHQPINDETCVFGHVHIGDGYVWAINSEQKGKPLTQGDHGEVSNEAYFVLSFSEDQVVARAQAFRTNAIEFFMVVTDGIEEDLKPSSREYQNGVRKEDKFAQYSQRLRERVLVWPCWEEWGMLLDTVINYDRDDSFDDRTIAVLTHMPPSTEGCPRDSTQERQYD